MPTPIEMPSPLPVNSKEFDLNFVQDVSPVGAGFIQAIERAPPMWVAKFETPALNVSRANALQTFFDDLGGATGAFLAYDPRKPRPQAYMANIGSEPWLANPAVAAVVTDADYAGGTLNLALLAVGAIITSGDYISYKRGNAWYLHRARAGAVANGSGIITGLPVTPKPPTSTVDVNARMTKACCAMKILGRVNKTDKLEDPGPRFAWAGVQFVDRS